MTKLESMQKAGKGWTCPKGHALPHRVGSGRCTPLDCCESGEVAGESPVTRAQELTAYAEETRLLAEARDVFKARDEVHALPPVPEAPKLGTVGVKEYMRQRLEQIAPMALERRIRKMLLEPGSSGEAAAQELLDRAGFSRHPDGVVDFSGPVVIVGQFKNPYEKQLNKGVEHAGREGDSVPEAAAEGPARADAHPGGVAREAE